MTNDVNDLLLALQTGVQVVPHHAQGELRHGGDGLPHHHVHAAGHQHVGGRHPRQEHGLRPHGPLLRRVLRRPLPRLLCPLHRQNGHQTRR